MDTTEETGTPVGATPEPTTPPLRTPITLVPPPLSPQQVQDVIDAINAAKKAIDSLGALGGLFAKWALNRVLEGLRLMGPIPPLGPPMGTQEPTVPPVTQTP